MPWSTPTADAHRIPPTHRESLSAGGPPNGCASGSPGPDKDLYAARSRLVEPVFGQTKHNRRIDRIYRRGRPAAQSEWRLACMTHNLLKLYRYRLATA